MSDTKFLKSITFAPSLYDSRVLAMVEVVFHAGMALTGLRLMKGRYGMFLTFPSAPRHVYGDINAGSRMALQKEVLEAWNEKMRAAA